MKKKYEARLIDFNEAIGKMASGSEPVYAFRSDPKQGDWNELYHVRIGEGGVYAVSVAKSSTWRLPDVSQDHFQACVNLSLMEWNEVGFKLLRKEPNRLFYFTLSQVSFLDEINNPGVIGRNAAIAVDLSKSRFAMYVSFLGSALDNSYLVENSAIEDHFLVTALNGKNDDKVIHKDDRRLESFELLAWVSKPEEDESK